jgi:hypothetical protein
MTKPNVPLSFQEIVCGGANDQPFLSDLPGDTEESADVPDPITKFIAAAELATVAGGRASFGKFTAETAVIDARTEQIYKSIAADAEKKIAGDDPQRLAKRFSLDPKAGYRQFFKERLAKGKSATEILENWFAEFPHRNPDVETLMREVAGEFA